jgi:methylmalonyl-CoA/ethylmalonyl-CoA epimerase
MESSIGSNWKFNHLGVVVRDMDAAVKYYESFGLFTFQKEFGGGEGRARMRMAESGQNRIELIAPSSGPPMFREFLDTKGEGIHHIAYTVDSLDSEMAAMAAKNVPVIMGMRRTDGSGIAFYDFRKIGGVVIELMQMQKPS